jgi:hypothetical protein
MTAPPRRRRCSAVTSSRDGVFSAPAVPRASPRVFCAAALVSPRLLRRPRSQALRQALLPQSRRHEAAQGSADGGRSFGTSCKPSGTAHDCWRGADRTTESAEFGAVAAFMLACTCRGRGGPRCSSHCIARLRGYHYRRMALRRTWRRADVVTQLPLTMCMPAPQAWRTCVIMLSG